MEAEGMTESSDTADGGARVLPHRDSSGILEWWHIRT